MYDVVAKPKHAEIGMIFEHFLTMFEGLYEYHLKKETGKKVLLFINPNLFWDSA